MASDRLTKKTLVLHREMMLAQQGGLCALCHDKVERNEVACDHDHRTGVVRGVLHRGCNVMLGKIENGRSRNGLTDDAKLQALLVNVTAYLLRGKQDGPRYPTHRNAEERKARRNKKARTKRALSKVAKAQNPSPSALA